MRFLRQILPASILLVLSIGMPSLAAGNMELQASATILSWGTCWINGGSRDLMLDFGQLDPLNPVDVTVNASMQFSCFGFGSTTYYVSHDSGRNESAPGRNRLQNIGDPTEFLPYGLSIAPASGTLPGWLTTRTVNVTGVVRGSDYRTAAAGDYTDRVTVTILP